MLRQQQQSIKPSLQHLLSLEFYGLDAIKLILVLGSVGHAVSFTIIQLCHCSRKAATDSMEIKGHGCVPVKLYLWK